MKMDPSVGYWPVKDISQLNADSKHMIDNFHHTRPLNSPKTHTTSPTVTGASILGIKYKDGIMLAADTLASYGSLARFRVERIKKIGEGTLIAASGDLSDFQAILRTLERMVVNDYCTNDGYKMTAHEFFSYLSRMMYQRRCDMNPLWNQLLVAGFDAQGESLLGYTDLYGTAYKEKVVATGYGTYLAIPLLRKFQSDDMTELDARNLLEDCLKVLFYRDARSSSKIQIATIKLSEINISEPYELGNDWHIGLKESYTSS